mmetsp:Transcript_122365/g.243576  ORF Transcript_122365/g.243576 Transcript_122365/m.243576 type:complete len:176 (-) Transcript_122365:875-1402(-)
MSTTIGKLWTCCIDPETTKFCQKWSKDATHLYSQFETHKQLKEKYDLLSPHNLLHTRLQSEVDYLWQWPKCYVKAAQPVVGETVADMHYDFDAAWRAMRLRHARKCMGWIKAQQVKCLEMLSRSVQVDMQKQNLKDRLLVRFATACITNDRKKNRIFRHAKESVESFTDEHMPQV